MSRKREAIFMGIGILAGLALSGPAAQAATTITATLSNQPIYVDGQRVSMTGSSIPHYTAPPAMGHTAEASTAQAGPRCALMPPSVISRGGR